MNFKFSNDDTAYTHFWEGTVASRGLLAVDWCSTGMVGKTVALVGQEERARWGVVVVEEDCNSW